MLRIIGIANKCYNYCVSYRLNYYGVLMKKGLIALMFGGVGIGLTEFVMAGLLPDLVSHLKISVPVAGHLISNYALGVVVGAPIIVLAAGKVPPRKLLIILMAIFTIFNGLSALAPNYHVLLITRFLSGIPHGAYFGVGAVVASRMAKRGMESRAVAVMFSGLTLANLIGVPIGTYIGHYYSWRYTFLLITLIGIITMLSLKAWLPFFESTKPKRIKHELLFFSHLDSWIIITFVSIGTAGLFAWVSYIAPLLIGITHFNPNLISYIMAIAGVGMVVGNILGGKLADKYLPSNTILCSLLLMVISLIITHYVAPYKIISLIMIFMTGVIAFSLAAPIQILMIRSAKGSELLAASVVHGAFNIGNALGAFLGGLPLIYGFNYDSPQLVGAGMAFVGAMVVILLKYLYKNIY